MLTPYRFVLAGPAGLTPPGPFYPDATFMVSPTTAPGFYPGSTRSQAIVDVSAVLLEMMENDDPAIIPPTCKNPTVPPGLMLVRNMRVLAVTDVLETRAWPTPPPSKIGRAHV